MNVVFISAPGASVEPLAEMATAHGHAVSRLELPGAPAEAVEAAGADAIVITGSGPGDSLRALEAARRGGGGATVLAGAPTLAEQLEAIEAGADDIFDPSAPETLIARLAVLERRSRQRRPPATADILVANAADAIYTISLDGYFTSANPAGEELTGYPLSEIIGMHMSRLVVPEHLEAIRREMAAKVAGEKQSSLVAIDIIRADGERIPVEITSRLLIQDGKVAGIQGLARDLRARRRLEHDIAFRAELLDNVEAATYAGDMEGRVIYWNSAAAELFGYSAEEALGANVGKLLVPAGEAKRAEHNVAELRAGRKVVGEYLLKKKDGSTFPAHVTNAPVFHGDGSVAAIVAICIDLTERRAQEERLAGLAAVVESSNDAVVQHDLEGRITGWNAAAERIYGYTAEEVLGRHFSILAPEHEREAVEAVRQRVLAGLRVTGHAGQRLRRDGTLIDLNLAFFPVHGPDGRVAGTATVARDVTEQARAEAERRRLAAIVDSATEAIIGRDNQRRVVSWNGAAERLFGWSLPELAGTFAWEIVPEDRVEETREMAARLRDGLTVAAETERVDRAGRRFPVELNAFPVRDASGAVVGSATFIRDISEKKSAERALEESRARYRAAVDASHDGFFIFQAERDETGAISDFIFTALNPAAEQLIGRKAEEVMGGRLCELIPVNRTGGFFERYVRVVETGEPLDEEFAIEAAGIRALDPPHGGEAGRRSGHHEPGHHPEETG